MEIIKIGVLIMALLMIPIFAEGKTLEYDFSRPLPEDLQFREVGNDYLSLTHENNYVNLTPYFINNGGQRINLPLASIITKINVYDRQIKWSHSLARLQGMKQIGLEINSNLKCRAIDSVLSCNPLQMNFNDLVRMGFNITLNSSDLIIDGLPEGEILLDPTITFDSSPITQPKMSIYLMSGTDVYPIENTYCTGLGCDTDITGDDNFDFPDGVKRVCGGGPNTQCGHRFAVSLNVSTDLINLYNITLDISDGCVTAVELWNHTGTSWYEIYNSSTESINLTRSRNEINFTSFINNTVEGVGNWTTILGYFFGADGGECLSNTNTDYFRLIVHYIEKAITINQNGTMQAIPRYNDNLSIFANVTSDAEDPIFEVNFTLIAPNGTIIINNKNGTIGEGNYWNSTSFTLQGYIFGDWFWNISGLTKYRRNTESSGNFTLADNINPNITITSPSGTLDSRTITANVTLKDNLNSLSAIDTCHYNVTRGASTEISITNIENCLNNNSFIMTVSADADYVFTIFLNDTAGNRNQTASSFSVDTTTGQGRGGGGGGGAPGPTLFSIGQECSSNSQCFSNFCVHGTCREQAFFCGDEFCDEGENGNSCNIDCGFIAQFKAGKPGFILTTFFAVLIISLGFLFFSKERKSRNTILQRMIPKDLRGRKEI